MTVAESASCGETGTAPPFVEALRVWLKIGVMSFGGPAAQIALMHRIIVEEQRWLSERQYLNALSFCMLLPGPEAMQLATYAGWRLHGVAGGLAAGLSFVLPGAAVILALASVYAVFGDVPLVGALFLGIKAAVIVIVVEALVRISGRALRHAWHWAIAGLAFVGIFMFDIPYPLLIGIAALAGYFSAGPVVKMEAEPERRRSAGATAATVLVWLVLWWAPLAMVAVVAGDTILPAIGLFFSKLAVVTFGGAYAVLAYMAQDVVQHFGWLAPGEMMDGLGLAETTPGPLILVTEFVGFLAAYHTGGIWLGLAGAAVTLWVTFVPCFLWIFVFSPYIDWIAARPRLAGALAAITAAVVGVILNLTIWFALHVFFADVNAESYGWVRIWQPVIGTFDWRVAVLSVMCAVLVFRFRWTIVRTLLTASIFGAGWALWIP